jgi:hypothetical protein
VPDDEWRTLLGEHLKRADSFRVHVPDGDGPLSYGRVEFMALPGVVVQPWSGMRDAIEITGPLSPAARDLFLRMEPWSGMRDAIEITGPLSPGARDLFLRMEPSIESFDPQHKLWDYELVENGVVILSIGDYHDLQVEIRPT